MVASLWITVYIRNLAIS